MMRIWIPPLRIPRSCMGVGRIPLLDHFVIKTLPALYPPSGDPLSVHQNLIFPGPLPMPPDRYRYPPNLHAMVALKALAQLVAVQAIITWPHPRTLINTVVASVNNIPLLQPAHMTGSSSAGQYALQYLQALVRRPSQSRAYPHFPGTDLRGPHGVLSTHFAPLVTSICTGGSRVKCNFHTPILRHQMILLTNTSNGRK